MTTLYDVVEVSFDRIVLGFMGEGVSEPRAESIIGFAVARRGVESSFFSMRPAGAAKLGEPLPE